MSELVKVSFTIDYEWLTNHIRDLWMEGNWDNGLRVLESSGIPQRS